MKNSYWTGKGEHQDFVNALDEKAPCQGYTSNVFMNCYLAMSHLYYDAYNNGGGNIEDCYLKDFNTYIRPLLPNFDVFAFISCDERAMERMLNEGLEFLMDKPMDFPVYTVWLNSDGKKFSQIEPTADLTDKEKWGPVTFGMEEDKEEWCRMRRGFSKDVTEDFESRKPDLPELCFTVLRSTGELACIKRGESGYFSSDWNQSSQEKNRVTADLLNERLGVSEAQVKAMEFGSMFGWNSPGADPKTYMKSSLASQISGAEARKSSQDVPSHTKQNEQSL